MSSPAAPAQLPAVETATPARTVVHKFGGTSVADAERYRHVAQLLLAREESLQVTVVSAMKGVTDALIELAHTNDLLPLSLVGMSQPSCVTAYEPFVNPCLSLVAQIVVDAGNHHDQAITGVGSLAYQTGVVRCLAALDVPHNHAAATPPSLVLRIPEAIQHSIGHFVGRVDHRFR